MSFKDFSETQWECDFLTHPYNSPLAGLFIESRDHPKIEYALRNFSCMLPFASLCILHSKENQETIVRIIGDCPNVYRKLLPDNFGEIDCNLLKLSPELWKNNFKKILIFNVDTGIKHNSILRYLHYDYIGAPWNHFPTGDPRVFQGNGGFSLRDSEKTRQLAERYPCTIDNTQRVAMPEDVWYSHLFATLGGYTLPTREIAATFATEGNDIPETFGFHDTEKYTPETSNVYVIMDGPHRKLTHVCSAVIDDIHDVFPIVILGIGPKCLRLFKETDFGVCGSKLKIILKNFFNNEREVTLDLLDGRLKDNICIYN